MLVVLTNWINRSQAKWIDYLRTEIQVLKKKRGPRRILFNDDQHRRLDVKGKVLGRQRIDQIGSCPTATPCQVVEDTWLVLYSIH